MVRPEAFRMIFYVLFMLLILLGYVVSTTLSNKFSEDDNPVIELFGNIDGDSLTYYIKDPLQYMVHMNIIQDKIRYTPDVNYNGTDLIRYYVNDGTSDDISNINLTFSVNDDPITKDIYNH